MFKKFLQIILQHKFISLVCLVVAVGGGYYTYQHYHPTTVATTYVTALVIKGTITTSVNGTGQVSVSNQLDVKPKVSGDVVKVAVVNGQTVKAGDLLVQLDTRDVQKTIRDARANLESAKLSLTKLKQPADQLSLLQAQNALSQAQEAKQNALADLAKAYDDGFNTIANAFLDLPVIMSGLYDTLLGSSLSGGGQWNKNYYVDVVKAYDDRVVQYGDDAYATYQKAHTAYDKNFSDYKSANRDSDKATLEALINETYDTTKIISEAVKSSSNLVQFYQDKLTERSLRPAAQASIYLTNLNNYTGKAATDLSNILSTKTTIENDKQSIVDADRTIGEKTESLAKLKAGVDPLDIQSQELSIQQRENSLLDAEQTLPDYYVRAPFGGIVAIVNSKVGDSVSSGTAMTTLITIQRLADISLNEVDVAKIKVGQKAILTFSAIDGLSITGEVVDIAALGTVSQGVVSYDVKINFDTQDERVKTGMSLSATIITDIRQDVLLVPNSAIKTQRGVGTYVQILENGQPKNQSVQVGLVNDSMSEIISGVSEGQPVITKTTNASATTQTQSSSGGIIPGVGGGGGIRIGGGGIRGD